MNNRILIITTNPEKAFGKCQLALSVEGLLKPFRRTVYLPKNALERDWTDYAVVIANERELNGDAAPFAEKGAKAGVPTFLEIFGRDASPELRKALRVAVAAPVAAQAASEGSGKAQEPDPGSAAVVVDEVDHRAPAVEIVQVPFMAGQTIPAVHSKDGIWVVLKPLCESLQIDADAQMRRILREPWGKTTTVKMAAVADDGKIRDMNALRADMLAPWLFGVQVASVAPEKRPALEALKVEGAKVLAAYFTPQAAKAAGVDIGAIGRALVEADERFRRIEASIPAALAPVQQKAEEATTTAEGAAVMAQRALDEAQSLDGKLRGLVSALPVPRRRRRGLNAPVVSQPELWGAPARRAQHRRMCDVYASRGIELARRDPDEWDVDRTLYVRVGGTIWTRSRILANCQTGPQRKLSDAQVKLMSDCLQRAAREVIREELDTDIGDWKPEEWPSVTVNADDEKKPS